MNDLTFCVTMTTIPSRIKNIDEVISNIRNQTIKPNKIYLNIPHKYKRFPNEIIDEIDIENLKNEDLEITRCQDFGPGTKIMGSVEKIKKYDCVIILDDDHIYDKHIIEIFLEAYRKEKINYSFYLNKIFDIKMGQCADGFLINTHLLNGIEKFYDKYVKHNKNMFHDDDLWLAIYLQKEKKSKIKNLISTFFHKTNKKIVYKQNLNSEKNGLHLTIHKDGLLFNRRKIQKIEYLKYIFKNFLKD